jgi:hypothetical protein
MYTTRTGVVQLATMPLAQSTTAVLLSSLIPPRGFAGVF